MRRDYSSLYFIALLIIIILMTNPFTIKQNGKSVDFEANLDKINLIGNYNTLSDEQKKQFAQQYVTIARDLIRYDKYNKALEFLNAAQKLDPDYENIYTDLAEIHLARAFYKFTNNIKNIKESEDYKKAIELCQHSIDKDPQRTKGYDSLINIYMAVKDNDRALEAAKEACQVNDNYKYSCKKAADIYLTQGKKSDAIAFLNSVADKYSSTDNSWVYKRLGAIYRADGKLAEAEKCYKLLYKLNPSSENFELLMQSHYIK